MPKGGARARSGPPPDPNSLTQTDGEWITLPSAGRTGDVPEWPLAEATSRELELWAHEWTRPQSVMWERHGQEVEVAMYVRTLVKAEKHDAPVNARTLLRQQQEALGLSMPGMLRNRWRIGEVASAEDDGGEDQDDVRGRLTVVAGGA